MKIGMCGVRGMGREFAGLFGLHPAVESLAIADVDAGAREETRQKMEVSHAVETLDQLLDLNLDSIGVFTPPWTQPCAETFEARPSHVSDRSRAAHQ